MAQPVDTQRQGFNCETKTDLIDRPMDHWSTFYNWSLFKEISSNVTHQRLFIGAEDYVAVQEAASNLRLNWLLMGYTV